MLPVSRWLSSCLVTTDSQTAARVLLETDGRSPRRLYTPCCVHYTAYTALSARRSTLLLTPVRHGVDVVCGTSYACGTIGTNAAFLRKQEAHFEVAASTRLQYSL